MKRIAENLQILKDSTDDIKQAIIDKGGKITGDISTWANAITGISDEEYVFTGTLSYGTSTVTITGNLNKVPDGARNYLLALGYTGGLVHASHYIDSTDSYTLTVDFYEPIMGEIPALCILHIEESTKGTYTLIPVKFKERLNTDPA